MFIGKHNASANAFSSKSKCVSYVLANNMLYYITGRVASYSYGYSSSSTASTSLHLTGGINFLNCKCLI